MAGQYDAFDVDDGAAYARPEKQIWEFDVFDQTQWPEISKWLQGEKTYLIEMNRVRFRTIENNLALYKGIQYQSQQLRDDSRDRGVDRNQAVTKIVANHVFDLVQNKVSRLIKYRPGLAVLPTGNELEDKVGAKMSKTLIDHIWYLQNFEGEIQNEFVKLVHVMGECFLATVWDPDAGEIHEDMKPYLQDLQKGKKVTLKQDDGNPEVDDKGRPIELDGIVRYGDVVYEIWYTLDCLLERKQQYRDVDYMFHKKAMSLAEAKKRYGSGISQIISSDGDGLIYDYEKMNTMKLRNEVIRWKFYHRKTKMMPQGAEITFINNLIVDVKPLKSTSGDLPVNRLTDVDLPGELHGVSFIQIIKGLTGTYNNVLNMIVRNHAMVSHPKWVFPAGSVKKESLGNDITLVEYKGPQGPILQQQNPTPPEIFSWLPNLKQEFQQLAGFFGVSRGEPPPGIKAGVALQFLAEQENERFNEMVLKYNEWIRQSGLATLERAADNYEPDDKRMIMVLGRNNQWMTTFFNVEYLARKYDVRIQNSSALPQSKAARTQYLLDLNQQFPNKVSADQVLDMLDLAQPEKFLDFTTVSVKAAEAENEAMMQSIKEINDPEQYEDHIQHWKIHVKQCREWAFKNQTPKEIKDVFEGHILATEMLMDQKAQTNPAYGQLLSQCEGFPLFYVPAPPLPPPAPVPPMGASADMPAGLPAGLAPEPQDSVNIQPPGLLKQQEGANQMPPPTGPIEPTNAI